jgi:hypothetical protein
MADILISAVSTTYTGTENADDFQNTIGSIRDITVEGGSGSDILTIASGTKDSDGADGQRLRFSIASADLNLGFGDDTLDFIGNDASGQAKFDDSNVRMGQGDDLALIAGVASANASTIRGNEGNDEIRFASFTGASTTATDLRLNGNAGADDIQFTWSGTEAKGFGILGGAYNDTVSATFTTNISAFGSADNTFTGAKIGGNKGDDVIVANFLGTSDQVRVNGNSGSDTIVVTAAADNVRFGVAGGKDNDVISAVFVGGNTSEAATVAGSLGNDTVSLTLQSGGRISGFALNGASGDDVLTFTNNGGVALTASTGNVIAGGTGADTITLNVGADIVSTGASGFVVDLGGDGAGVLDVNLSANITARTGAGAFFRGSTTGDDIDVTNATGVAVGLFNVTFSAEAGNDTITFAPESAGTYSATTFNAGSGADLITAQIAANTQLAIATGGRIAFEGGSGSDTIVANIESATSLSAGLFDGGAGADSISLNLISGGSASVVNSGTELAGGLGNDTIALAATLPTTAAAVIRAGSGTDVITGTFASGGLANAVTAAGGSGADTIAFTFTAAATAGITLAGAGGSTFNGGAGADSITVLGAAVTGGTIDVGSLQGGDGADTITFGGTLGVTGDTTTVTGQIVGGAGADSIIFSGNNVVSGSNAVFVGNGAVGTGGFGYTSGDSTRSVLDVISVANNAVTGGQTAQAGTFGSAGFVFTSMGDATFTMAIDAASDGASNASGGLTAGNAIFIESGGEQSTMLLTLDGGVVGGGSAGGVGSAGSVGTFVITGGSTLAQIVSAVDALAVGRGTTNVFNAQNGSGGSIDGYLFVQGGTLGGDSLADTVIKFEGAGLDAGAYALGDGYFSAGADAGLARVNATSNSAGEIYFGQSVGVG